jgi:hypothetical protein
MHEGGGFYRHTFEDHNHNQMKLGQSIIADADSFYVEKESKYLNLKQIAEAVINEVNKYIENDSFTFRFNNHNTLSRETNHLEQRKSATYFGLTQLNIPSFGVEVSKQLPSQSLKNLYTKYIIDEFLSYLDIQIDYPSLAEPEPVLNYLLVKVNDEKRFVEPKDTITLEENATLQIVGVSTNYSRGNYVDVAGLGNRNDLNKTFTISRNTDILVYKDNLSIATIPVRINKGAVAFEGFRVNLLNDNKTQNVFAGDTLTVTDGASFEIIGSLNNTPNINITIVGATVRHRQGRQIIDTGTGLSEKFAINKEKNLYEIIIKNRNTTIAKAYLKIRPLEAYGLHITHNEKFMIIAPGDTIFAKYNDKLFIHDVELNQVSHDKVKVNFAGYVVNPQKEAEDRGGDITLNNKGLIPSFATNKAKDLYEIHILYKQKRYATYYVKIGEPL